MKKQMPLRRWMQSPPARSLRRAERVMLLGVLVFSAAWLAPISFSLPPLHFLHLHTAIESLAVLMGILVFAIAWNAYSSERPGNVVLIAAVLLGVAVIDFGHTLAYRGMPDFVTPSSPQKSISFWLAARFWAAAGLLAVALRPWQPLPSPRLRHLALAASLVFAALTYWLILFHADLLPVFFIDGQGLTPVKMVAEWGITILCVFAAVVFYGQARAGTQYDAASLFLAAGFSAVGELCFTLYVSITDYFNILGHLYKVLAYWFIYRAIFVESVRQPFDALHAVLEEERELLAEQRDFVRTFDMLEEAVVQVDRSGRLQHANNGWWRLAGSDPSSVPRGGFILFDTFVAEDRNTLDGQFGLLFAGAKTQAGGRYRIRREGGEEFWVECRFIPEYDAAGKVCAARGILRDITKTYAQERHITHMALHDALTGLPNRLLLEDRLQSAMSVAARGNARVAVCFIDLDHFKNINDTYGHKAGDALLINLAQALRGELRGGDTLARWGGDEFVVLLPEVRDMGDVRQVADKLSAVMRRGFDIEGLEVHLTFSMGVAVYPDDGEAMETLLSQADRAMFYAKAQGRNNCQFYADMSTKGLGKKELYIQTRLAQAIRGGRIEVWYQPIIDAGSGRIACLEALARWHDDDLGWVPAATFVPMAENLGMIIELGNQVRQQALARLGEWRKLRPDLRLSINISKRQLFASHFIEALEDDLGLAGLSPRDITLEITESVALMDVEYAEERLRDLAERGFALAIDDFGTGYASLSQLHELPVSEIKVDISFVRRVHTEQGRRMVQAIVNIARALNLRSVAEGIEDEDTARVLREYGVDYLQGYWFGKPEPAEAITRLLDHKG